MSNLVIDPEFKALIPALDSKEYEALEASILAEGCRDALVIWNDGESDILIDGHNRYEICTKHQLPFNRVYRQFKTRRDVRIWMRKNQIARRNIPEFLRNEFAWDNAGEIEEAAKERRLSNLKHGRNTPERVGLHERGRTDEKIAQETGSSQSTANRVKQVRDRAPEPIKDKARQGKITTNQAYNLTREYEKLPEPVRNKVAELPSGENLEDVKALATLAKKSPEKVEEIVNTVVSGKADTIHRAIEKDAHAKKIVNIGSSKSNEWYTPGKYIESARAVMGGFDVDPASNDMAQETIQATAYYTIETNGLDKEWHGRIWLNPPYGSSNRDFIDKLIAEVSAGHVTEAIVLVNSHSTDANWFQPLWDYTLCFTNHRINFISPDGKPESGSNHGSVFVYIGTNTDKFACEFGQYGTVVQKYVPKDIAKVA